MSELITRRTFLKATGAAALAVAASGMLAGCGDGAYASTPLFALPFYRAARFIVDLENEWKLSFQRE